MYIYPNLLFISRSNSFNCGQDPREYRRTGQIAQGIGGGHDHAAAEGENQAQGKADTGGHDLRRQAEAEADAAKKEALTAEANRLSAQAFTPIYDREKLWIELDPDKAARLQKIIAEEIAKYDAAHQG